MITQDYLKSVVDYNPLTGVFTLKVDSGKKKAGERAEHRDVFGYMITTLPGKRGKFGGGQKRSHRLAFLYMLGEWPEEEVDHINGDRSDNRWINLRPVTSSENGRNSSVSSRNTSGVVGVSYHKKRKQWRARIAQRHLGWFSTKEEAIAARQNDPEFKTFTERHGK